MDGWDIFLWTLSGYVATMALARLMLRRRNHLIDELVREAEEAEKAKVAEEAEKAKVAEKAATHKQNKQKAA